MALLLLVPLGWSDGRAALSAPGFGIEERIALEKVVKENVSEVTEKILGSNDFIVWVDIVTDLELSQETRNVRSPTTRREVERGSVELPGFAQEFLPSSLKPQKGDAASPIVEQVAQTLKIPSNIIKQIRIRLLLPQGLESQRIADLRRILPPLVGLLPDRGDEFLVENVNFRQDPIEAFFYWKDHLNPLVFGILGLAVLTLFLFGPVRRFLNHIARSMETLSIRGEGQFLTRSAVSINRPEMPVLNAQAEREIGVGASPRGLLPGGEPEGEADGKPFGFIHAQNLNKVLMVLKQENNVQAMAAVVAYLTPELSSQFLAQLDTDRQRQIMLMLSSPKPLNPNAIRALHERLKAQVDYIVGGAEQLLQIMDEQSMEQQQVLLEELRGDRPEVVQEIERRMLTIEKIFQLEPTVLQVVLWEAYRQRVALGIFFRILSKDLQKKALEILPEGLSRVVRDEMNAPLPAAAQQDRVRKQFLQVARALEKEGRFTLPAA
ncbi:MAG: hypothetical protein HY402_05510 [Elusimicrobia bacterium]|nr:hypothetical protein [Elusimicrobiota bacterium]